MIASILRDSVSPVPMQPAPTQKLAKPLLQLEVMCDLVIRVEETFWDQLEL